MKSNKPKKNMLFKRNDWKIDLIYYIRARVLMLPNRVKRKKEKEMKYSVLFQGDIQFGKLKCRVPYANQNVKMLYSNTTPKVNFFVLSKKIGLVRTLYKN